MNYRSYEWRIITCLILLLMFIQVGGYWVVVQSNRTIAATTLDDELRIGAQVINRLLTLRHDRLDQAASVIARDFGLREALASGDLPTIRSMLDNHGKRMNASLMILSDLAHQPITLLAPGGGPVPTEVDAAALLGASQGAQIARLAVGHDQIYQLVSTPIMSPDLAGWLTMGFLLDETLLSDLGELNGIEVSVLSRTRDGMWGGLSSTLNDAVFRELELEAQAIGGWQLETQTGRFQMLSIPLDAEDAPELVMVLGLSLEEALVSYKKMETVILIMLVIGLLLSALAVYYVTRNMVGPLNRMAHLDSLTGLANRRLLGLAMQRAEAERLRMGTPYALFMLDLNKFKALNDTHGHAVGDQVLKTVAQRLLATLRSTDTVARQGGDEFVILLPGATENHIRQMAEKVVSVLTQPVEIGNQVITVGVSLGVAVADVSNTLAPEQLLNIADKALYRAKAGSSDYVLASSFAHDAPAPREDG
ncbi:diguanylate cyclase [uncultured Halopseudomonas sp.]|uniref:GGDEF domain-containing protein n=1 Tax=uncultured Halopseudomonas sp. TaxID=2901193 RepID=UPI0030EE588E|tara:strand:- start:1545 stop:2978 length:1434 start_codon:yes stop_codon:yes gene_type:complete